MSAIVIGAALMMLALGAGRAGIYARWDAMASEHKRIALGLAESCAQVALVRFAQSDDPSRYATIDEEVSVGENACTIVSIAHAGEEATITTRAAFGRSYSIVSVHVRLYALPVPPGHERVEALEWREGY